MHRLNLTIDEPLYERARAVSFLHKISISELIRQSLSEFIAKSGSEEKAELLLEADDEEEIRAIIAENSFSTQADFARRFGL